MQLSHNYHYPLQHLAHQPRLRDSVQEDRLCQDGGLQPDEDEPRREVQQGASHRNLIPKSDRDTTLKVTIAFFIRIV